jgi:hypothetical protein
MDPTLRTQLQLPGGDYLFWAGDDIWTGQSVPPFGFEWTADEGVKNATFEVWMFRDGTALFQTESFFVSEFPFGAFLPVTTK